MATPKRPTREQANENRRKQQVLKQAGYNIKIDGSWGPWSEQQYRKVTTQKAPKTNQASVGVMALPAAAALGSGAGSLTLPAISASSLAAALPVALIAGPIAAEVYNQRHGIYPRTELTPEQRQSTVYSPDATRVSRPIVVSRRAPVEMERPIGEMYINPSLARSKAISMATDSTTVTPRDTATVAPRDTATATPQNPPNPTNDNEPQNKRGWRDRLADRVSNAIRGKKKPVNQQAPQNGNTSEKFGKGLKTAYKWSWYVPTAIDVVGNVVGAVRNIDTYSPSFPALKGRTAPVRGIYNLFGRYYNPQATDSTTVTPPNNPNNSNKLKANQDTTNQYSTLDSIRAAAHQASLNYLDSLELNQ